MSEWCPYCGCEEFSPRATVEGDSYECDDCGMTFDEPAGG